MNQLLAKIAVRLVSLYQRFISPVLGPSCRFRPTCSEYMIQALQKYGFLKGFWLGLKRVGRCHPFNPGGYDPLI
ncbi:MAG TPA: membrane protein insertion efficiency factor YidD [Firmicutes bacterium]|jgi:hypothetical protein|nr:membrane protein insertion efficiency factor YidD [Bacillota bacterium]